MARQQEGASAGSNHPRGGSGYSVLQGKVQGGLAAPFRGVKAAGPEDVPRREVFQAVKEEAAVCAPQGRGSGVRERILPPRYPAVAQVHPAHLPPR